MNHLKRIWEKYDKVYKSTDYMQCNRNEMFNTPAVYNISKWPETFTRNVSIKQQNIPETRPDVYFEYI